MPSSKILVAVLGVWSIGSAAFIVYDRWHHFAAEEPARAADQGRREILGQIIREAAKCRPFSAANGEQTAELIGTSCLSQGASPERGALPVQAPPMLGPPLAESGQPLRQAARSTAASAAHTSLHAMATGIWSNSWRA